MSYSIIRMIKIKKNSIRNIQNHDMRIGKNSNPDVEENLKDKNYFLKYEEDYNKKTKQNITNLNLKRKLRKDANLMCQFVVTSDSEFFKNITETEQKLFFEDSLSFIQKKYGEENIISAVVHLDEKTPHMHVNFTPIVGKSLSADKLSKFGEYKKLQTEFHKEVGLKYNLERGKTYDKDNPKPKRHQSVADFKRDTNYQDIKKGANLISGFNKINPIDIEPRGIIFKEKNVDIAKRLSKDILEPIILASQWDIKEFDSLVLQENQALQQENEELRKGLVPPLQAQKEYYEGIIVQKEEEHANVIDKLDAKHFDNIKAIKEQSTSQVEHWKNKFESKEQELNNLRSISSKNTNKDLEEKKKIEEEVAEERKKNQILQDKLNKAQEEIKKLNEQLKRFLLLPKQLFDKALETYQKSKNVAVERNTGMTR